jgi:hypothetical protein
MRLDEIFDFDPSENPNVWWYKNGDRTHIRLSSEEHHRDLYLRQHEYGLDINSEMGEHSRW